jgi:tetratricopeptide (TPR) repeat protein
VYKTQQRVSKQTHLVCFRLPNFTKMMMRNHLINRILMRGNALQGKPFPTIVVSRNDQIRGIVKVTKNADSGRIQLLKNLNEDVLKWHSQGNLTQACNAADYAIQRAREEFGPDHVSVASAFSNRGFIAKELGELDDAIELYELALKIYDKQEKVQHGKTIVLQNLGNVLRSLSNEEKDLTKKMELRYRAKTYLEDALKAIADADGKKSLKYASAMQKLANLNKDMKNLKVAEDMLRETVAIAKEVDENSRVLFSAMNDLALVLKTQGSSFQEARSLYEQAIDYATTRFGENNKETIVYKHNLAELLDTDEETKQDATKLRLNILMSDPKVK